MAHMQWISGTKQILIKNITSICFPWGFYRRSFGEAVGKVAPGVWWHVFHNSAADYGENGYPEKNLFTIR